MFPSAEVTPTAYAYAWAYAWATAMVASDNGHEDLPVASHSAFGCGSATKRRVRRARLVIRDIGVVRVSTSRNSKRYHSHCDIASWAWENRVAIISTE